MRRLCRPGACAVCIHKNLFKIPARRGRQAGWGGPEVRAKLANSTGYHGLSTGYWPRHVYPVTPCHPIPNRFLPARAEILNRLQWRLAQPDDRVGGNSTKALPRPLAAAAP